MILNQNLSSRADASDATYEVMPHSKRHRHHWAFGCIALISAMLMCACSIPSVRWTATDVAGPPLASGKPTKQVHRCDVVTAQSPWASTGGFNRCDIAFRSDDGVQIDAFGVQRDISAALPRALPLRPLLEQFRSTTRGSNGPIERYTLYLVAVNPIVVVGIPDKPGDASCLAPGWTKCFAAVENYPLDQRYAQRSSFTVYYNTRPPVRNGSFVLVPEWQTTSMPLHTERQTATFGERGTTITLVQRENTWQTSGSTP
jgi:hypothetical protein